MEKMLEAADIYEPSEIEIEHIRLVKILINRYDYEEITNFSLEQMIYKVIKWKRSNSMFSTRRTFNNNTKVWHFEPFYKY